MNPVEELIGSFSGQPRFIIFASYGYDSIALIRWAYENDLRDVVVVYSDTHWSAAWWADRIERFEFWVHSLGFWTSRADSIGFKNHVRATKGFPSQKYQHCSYELKIKPGEEWLAKHDPERCAVCLVGVPREESSERAEFPRFMLNSRSHGGRVMVTPLADYDEEGRDILLSRAGVTPLPHRSMECFPSINSNRQDLLKLAEHPERIDEIEEFEREMGFGSRRPRNGKVVGAMFRPSRHMGAEGIREVVKWAKAGRGKYVPPSGMVIQPDELDELDPGCESGWCGI